MSSHHNRYTSASSKCSPIFWGYLGAALQGSLLLITGQAFNRITQVRKNVPAEELKQLPRRYQFALFGFGALFGWYSTSTYLLRQAVYGTYEQ
jgi:hypothetical protein